MRHMTQQGFLTLPSPIQHFAPFPHRSNILHPSLTDSSFRTIPWPIHRFTPFPHRFNISHPSLTDSSFCTLPSPIHRFAPFSHWFNVSHPSLTDSMFHTLPSLIHSHAYTAAIVASPHQISHFTLMLVISPSWFLTCMPFWICDQFFRSSFWYPFFTPIVEFHPTLYSWCNANIWNGSKENVDQNSCRNVLLLLYCLFIGQSFLYASLHFTSLLHFFDFRRSQQRTLHSSQSCIRVLSSPVFAMPASSFRVPTMVLAGRPWLFLTWVGSPRLMRMLVALGARDSDLLV